MTSNGNTCRRLQYEECGCAPGSGFTAAADTCDCKFASTGLNSITDKGIKCPYKKDMGTRNSLFVNIILNLGRLAEGEKLIGGNYKLIMQSSGNLELFNASNKLIWNSGTAGKGKGPYQAIMQGDGNFVIYDGTPSPIWGTNTYNPDNGPHVLIMQEDGNLVLYQKNGPAWNSGTWMQ
jgi:hypothetical protein